MKSLPHKYLEENLLHGFLIEQIKDIKQALDETENYLPYIDNRAACDSFNPKTFNKNPNLIYEKIIIWIQSSHIYTTRFAIGLLLSNFLE